MAVPAKYAWLNDVGPLPRMVAEALKLHGTVELAGAANSPTIMGWAKEVGLSKTYSADSIPWCGLFLAVVARRAGKPVVKDPLWALNWLKFGANAGQPELGDIVCFIRKGGGHVALYIGEDSSAYHVLGGNQADAVTITRIAKERLKGARNLYAIGAPASARPYVLAPGGALSENEA